MERIPASDRTREKLKALMEGRSEVADGRSELVRLAARLIIEEALKARPATPVGRDYYAAAPRPAADIATAIGQGACTARRGDRVQCAADRRPQRAVSLAHSRGGARPYRGAREPAVEMYARGLSTRDIEAVFTDTDGRSLLAGARERDHERLWAEYEAFAKP